MNCCFQLSQFQFFPEFLLSTFSFLLFIPGVKAKWHIILPVVLMLAFAVTRWPGLLPSNFSAAYALAFCAGVYFPRRLIWLPLATMLGSDILLNLFYYHRDAVSFYMLGNYAAYALLMGLGRWQSQKASWLRLVTGGVAGAAIFYVITNTIAWLQDSNYEKSWAGWLAALTTGVPGWPPPWMFLRNSLLSGGLFTGLFAGAMKWSEKMEEASEEAEEEAEEEEPEEEPEKAES